MNGVESVPNVDRNVNPIRVLIEGGADGMSDKLKARAAGNANLNRPRGTAWLVRGRGRARRRRLQVRGKGEAVLVSGDHGDGAADGRPYGNGPELTLVDLSIRAVAILAQGNEAAAEEPRADVGRNASLVKEGEEPPQGVGTSTRDKGGKGPGGLLRPLGREVTVGPGEVLIPPPGMVSSRAAREAAVHDLVKGSAGEGLIGGGRGQVLKRAGGKARGVGGEAVIVWRMEGLQGGDGGSDGRGESEGVSPLCGARELAGMDESKDVSGDALVICLVEEAARGRGDGEERRPTAREKGIAAITEDNVDVVGGGMAPLAAVPTHERARG